MKIKKRILLILDDEPDIFWAMEHLLKQDGFALIRALNGLETLAIMEKNILAWFCSTPNCLILRVWHWQEK